MSDQIAPFFTRYIVLVFVPNATFGTQNSFSFNSENFIHHRQILPNFNFSILSKYGIIIPKCPFLMFNPFNCGDLLDILMAESASLALNTIVRLQVSHASRTHKQGRNLILIHDYSNKY